MENLGDKIILGTNLAKPQKINMIEDVYSELFKEELQNIKDGYQSLNELEKVLKSW